MKIIPLDFETRSACNLITEGAYRYATDYTTNVICCSYKDFDGVIRSWAPPWVAALLPDCEFDDPPPFGEGIYYQAVNSQFDRLIEQNICTDLYDWPYIPTERWICVASIARGNGLPGKLEDMAKALQIKNQKNQRGKELIKLLSIPCGGTREQPVFNEDPDLLLEMVEYCEDDVLAESSAADCLRPFTQQELREFWASERINDRGVLVDIDFAKKAMSYSSVEMAVLEKELYAVTNGAVERPTQYQRVKNWLLEGREAMPDPDEKGDRYLTIEGEHPRISDEVMPYITMYKKGERKISLDKSVRNNILTVEKENPGFITDTVKKAIELTDLAGRSSTAKYKRMAQRHIDGRLHGMYMFNGAKSTGRFSSVGVQLHNMTRESVDDFDKTKEDLADQTDLQVIHTLAKMMRQTFMAEPGKKLYWSDWSNIEGRMCPWLSLDPRAEDKLDLFRHQDAFPKDPDVYEMMAEKMGLTDRQTGKVAELSLQFGGAVGALIAMARNNKVNINEVFGRKIVKLWREANPWAEPFWWAVKDAAWDAITSPNKIFPVGRVSYFYTEKTHNGLGTLWCKLPSGRLLSYVAPRFERVPTPWNTEETMVELTALKANFKPKAGETEWPRHKLWYGVLVENFTQAACADLLRHKLTYAPAELLDDMVLHTHDELVVESGKNIGKKLQQHMMSPVPWLPNFPLYADLNSGKRYRKS